MELQVRKSETYQVIVAMIFILGAIMILIKLSYDLGYKKGYAKRHEATEQADCLTREDVVNELFPLEKGVYSINIPKDPNCLKFNGECLWF